MTLADNQAAEALPGYRKMYPMVYCGLYPVDTSRYNDLREALGMFLIAISEPTNYAASRFPSSD